MLYDGLTISAGSVITNLTIDSGTSYPADPDIGELFFRTDLGVLQVYTGTGWNMAVSASSLTGSTLPSNIVTSSLTSVGTLGSLTVTGNVTAAAPTASGHLTTKGYVDTAVAGVSVTASTLTGTTLASNVVNSSLTSVGTLGSLTVTGNVTAAEPTTGSHLATKSYVDNLATGLDPKNSVRVATTANITLSGLQTIDGVSLIAGDRVLVKDQNTAYQNGIYVVASGTWARATDFDGTPAAEVSSGAYVFVTSGTLQAATGWVLTTNDPITLNSTPLTFTQFSSAATTFNAGDLIGTTLASNVVSSSLTSVGTITSGTWNATLGAVSGAQLTNLNASALSNGTVNTARLGSGTANSITYLRGDNTWATISVAGSALTGTTLASGIVSSSLTSLGTLTSLSVSGSASLSGNTSLGAFSGTTTEVLGSNDDMLVLTANSGYVGGGGGAIYFRNYGSTYEPQARIKAGYSVSSDGGHSYLSFQTRTSVANGLEEVMRLGSGGGVTIVGQVIAGSFSGSGAALTSLNATNISSGTVNTARLGTGTANSTTYLRGDGTWSTVGGATSDAGTLTGNTLASNVVSSSLTSVGTLSSLTVTGNVTAADPTSNTHLATKQYVDNTDRMKFYVDTASTGNLTLSGGQTVDGVAMGLGNRILVKNQTNPLENGVYQGQVGAWVRMADFDSAAEVNGAVVVVKGGTTQAGTLWLQSANITTVGSQSMVFQQIAGSSSTTLAATGTYSFTTANTGVYGGVISSSPYSLLVCTAAAAGQRAWSNLVDSAGTWYLRAVNDGNTAQADPITITRSGMTMGTIRLAANSVNLVIGNQGLQLNGSPGTSGQVLVSQGASAAPIWSSSMSLSSLSVSGTSTLTGNVGINQSPSNDALAINGSIRVSAACPNGLAGSEGATIDYSPGNFVRFGHVPGTSGSAKPIVFCTNGNEIIRFTTTGAISFGGTGTNYGSAGQVLQSNGSSTPSWVTPTASVLNGTGLTSESSTTGTYVGRDGGATPVPQMVMNISGATAGNRASRVYVNNSGDIKWDILSDAFATQANFFTVSRSGSTIASVTLNGNSVNLTGLTAGLQLNGSAGTSGQVLTSNGSGAAPTWQAATSTSNLPRVTTITSSVVGKRVAVSSAQTITATTWSGGGSIAVGDIYSIYNDSGSPITLTAGAGLTMYKDGNATAVASVTLAPRGSCSVWYNTVSEVVLSGSII